MDHVIDTPWSQSLIIYWYQLEIESGTELHCIADSVVTVGKQQKRDRAPVDSKPSSRYRVAEKSNMCTLSGDYLLSLVVGCLTLLTYHLLFRRSWPKRRCVIDFWGVFVRRVIGTVNNLLRMARGVPWHVAFLTTVNISTKLTLV